MHPQKLYFLKEDSRINCGAKKNNAIESLVYHPFHEDNLIKGVAIGGAIFVKQTVTAVVGPIQSILESFRTGFSFLV